MSKDSSGRGKGGQGLLAKAEGGPLHRRPEPGRTAGLGRHLPHDTGKDDLRGSVPGNGTQGAEEEKERPVRLPEQIMNKQQIPYNASYLIYY